MLQYWSIISAFIVLNLFQISFVHSAPTLAQPNNHLLNGNDEEFQRTQNALMYLIRNVLEEPNPYERIILINHLREYLNRMCVVGVFGSSHADSCRQVVDLINHTYTNNGINEDENNETSNESHGLQKRFFCNGFIGCKNVSG